MCIHPLLTESRGRTNLNAVLRFLLTPMVYYVTACLVALLSLYYQSYSKSGTDFVCLFVLKPPATPEEQVQTRKLCIFITESFANGTELTQVLLLSITMYTENTWWCSLAWGLAYKSELREVEAVPPPISVWSPAHLHLSWVCIASSSSCHHFTYKDSTFKLRSMECNTEQCFLLTGECPKGSHSNPQGLCGTQSYHLRWLDPPGCGLHLTQLFILHKQWGFLFATEQTDLDSADLLPSGLKETEGWSNKIHYIYHFVSPYHELLRKGTKRITTEKSTVIVAPEHHMEKIAKATNHSTARAEVVELRWGCYKPLLCIII